MILRKHMNDFLNYHHLRYFWMVAREGTLRQAADKLRVSQPSISAQIQMLESVIGEKLFRRSGRRLELTEMGQRVLRYAHEIFSLGEELMMAVKQYPSGRPMQVQVGLADPMPKLISAKILKPIFSLDAPVQLSCRESPLPELLAQLVACRLDVVLADEPAPASLNVKVHNHLLGECGMTFCAMPKLANALRRNFPASLSDAPLLLPAGTCAWRRALEQWFRKVSIIPTPLAEFDDAALMKALAGEAVGVCPVPDVVMKESVKHFGFGLIGCVPECRVRYYAITAERRLTHPAVAAITESARSDLFS